MAPILWHTVVKAGNEVGRESRHVRILVETAVAYALLETTLDLLILQMRNIPGLLSVCVFKTIPIRLLIPHLLLRILLDVPNIVLFFHLHLD